MRRKLEDPPRFRTTAIVVIAFAVAFGYVEAVVVVYLRAALGFAMGVATTPGAATFDSFEAIEVARELATLVMIAAVGILAGRTRLERLAWAAVVFGTWDIVYYVGLRATIGWPPSLDTWDILFLVPAPWVAPVWAPLVVSAALVVTGLVAARRLGNAGRIAVGPGRAAAALAGGAMVIASFLLDLDPDPSSPWGGWPLFWLGMGLAVLAAAGAFAAGSESPTSQRTDQPAADPH